LGGAGVGFLRGFPRSLEESELDLSDPGSPIESFYTLLTRACCNGTVSFEILWKLRILAVYHDFY